MSLDAATGSVDDAHAGSAHVHGAHADRSAAAQQGRRQQVLLFGSAFLVFAAVAVVLGAGRRPYPDGFISAAAFPFGIWMLTAAVVLLGAGIAALTSPLFSVPWVLLIADAELSATPADTVVKWL